MSDDDRLALLARLAALERERKELEREVARLQNALDEALSQSNEALARIAALEREGAECIADMRRVQAEMVQEDVPGWPNSIEEWIARVQALEREGARLRGER